MTFAETAPRSARAPSDFAELSEIIKQRGLLTRRSHRYVVRFVVNALLLAGGWTAFALLGSSWWQLLTAVFLAVVFAQLSFVGHDAGHRQIFRSRRANNVVGHVHGALVGLSFAWWVSKHNRHHANPNHEDDDPDLDIPLLSFSSTQAQAKRGLTRWTTKYQAFLFLPLLTLEGMSLHVSSVQAVLRREVKAHRLEAVLLAAHVVGYLTAVFLVLSPLQALAFLAVHQGLWGVYLGCSFAPNHKGMPLLPEGERLDHLRKQVLTSRNVRGGRIVDFALGGLNYQIEHHLFPGMPRANLRHAQPLVQRFCAQRGLPYSQTSVIGSYADVLRHLHAVGAPLRAATRP
ncbi:delta fatty acid desaturase [Prauserella sp. PE36]|uniref:Acyl-CoA desaturase n=1 Tax=Prauserella endophytica TaxID=1592324 RepID=A0ABY2S7X0_9PSEU|nr:MULTISPECIES: acyl-CoA desaturase [Prauserella]PXY25907.1 delta fatty acid desaturase [Prauserella coralliicola]RBM22196.1 delta fatty acid desaturase [Prauserella sp. PE36]TKG71781.1 acyl-CoA desaturase [Prauserella endophytica]